jgi:hypothetical protein
MALALLIPAAAIAQAPVDSALARYINAIRAIDDHAHPMRPSRPRTRDWARRAAAR